MIHAHLVKRVLLHKNLKVAGCKLLANYTVFKNTVSIVKMSAHMHTTSENGINVRMARKAVIGVCQMTSTSVKSDNLHTVAALVASAKEKGAQMVFLPEACDYIGESKQQTIELAESLDGNFIKQCKEIAVDNGVWLSLGGVHIKGSSPDGTDKTLNTHVIIDTNGEIKATYAKTHLFDLDLSDSVKLIESDFVIPGENITPPVDTPVGRVGLAICYDMRFPELSLTLAQQGAQILTYPSAFTQVTGMAHWESILRCRSIETQCYVVAAAQTGKHNAKRSSYGHAMIVDPWGTVVAQCAEGTGVAVAEVDLDYLYRIRRDMPVFQHRRTDLYGRIEPLQGISYAPSPDDFPTYQFGHVNVTSEQVFYRTSLSYAFVNIKPVLPGHMLVASLRPAKCLSDLNPAEVTDLFITVQRVSEVVNKHFNASSTTIAVQDGPDAGQTVEHVHVHVIPRKPGDFAKNDDIYDKLQNHDHGWTENTTFRPEAEMAEESATMRKYFYSGGEFKSSL